MISLGGFRSLWVCFRFNPLKDIRQIIGASLHNSMSRPYLLTSLNDSQEIITLVVDDLPDHYITIRSLAKPTSAYIHILFGSSGHGKQLWHQPYGLLLRIRTCERSVATSYRMAPHMQLAVKPMVIMRTVVELIDNIHGLN